MNRLKDYFHFQREEKIAFFFLVAIIVGSIVFIQYRKSTVQEESHDFSSFEKKIQLFESSIEEREKSNKNDFASKRYSLPKEDHSRNYSLFNFDPNGLSIDDWMKLGLSRAQAEVIKNYETKGGRFYSKEDVMKMYTISDQKFAELEPFIQIDQGQFEKKWDEAKAWETPYEELEEEVYFDLNIVDSMNLLKLSGIGPAFSSRILEYRKNIGGFKRKEQLLEIWGMDSVRYQKIEKSLYVDTNFTIRKININSATADEMKMHPYISWNVANSIEKYRTQNGKYQNLEEIKNSHLINDSLYQKLLPYIRLK